MNDKRIEVIKALIEHSEEEININRLSKLTKIDYKNTYNIIKRLNTENIVHQERFGNAIRCTLNKKNHHMIFQTEFERRKRLLENKDIAVLYNKLNKLTIPMIVLLFGSHARGQKEKGSDIDLLVICEKERNEEIERTISLLPIKIHLTLLNWEEFLKMAKNREYTVVSEAIKHNIILIGIEDYYRLIEHAG